MCIKHINWALGAAVLITANNCLATEEKPEAWINLYYDGGRNTVKDATVDSQGNYYQVGQTIGEDRSYDFAIIKYLPDGTRAWAHSYAGEFYGADNALAVDVDNTGNVYVGGNIAGTLLDIGLVKYNSSGEFQWDARFDGEAGSYDLLKAMALDSQGNIYLLGQTSSLYTSYDFVIMKYAPDGTRLWLQTYDNPDGASTDLPNFMRVDAEDNLYVSGYGRNSAITVKYASNGDILWQQRHSAHVQWISDFKIDEAGNAYVAARSNNGTYSNPTNWDFLTIKYNSDGSQAWANFYNTPANSKDDIQKLSVDSDGNVIIMGNSVNAENLRDIALIKYRPDGTVAWSTITSEVGHFYLGTHMEVDSNNDVIVSGRDKTATGSENFFTIKFNGDDGQEIWRNSYNGPGDGGDNIQSLLLDKQNNIYISGNTTGVGTYADITTIKYRPNGEREWFSEYNNHSNGYDYAITMHLDPNNNVLIGGNSYADNTRVITALKYTQQPPYNFSGFLPPLQENNLYKQGQVLPIRFQLLDQDGQIIEDATPTLTLQYFEGDIPSGAPQIPDSVGPADSGNVFRYSEGIYIYNLATTNLIAGNYHLLVNVGDGSPDKAISIWLK